MSSRPRLSLSASAAVVVGLVALTPSAKAQDVKTTRTLTTQFKAKGLDAWYGIKPEDLSPVLIGPSWTVGTKGNPKTFGKVVELVIPEIDWGLFTTPAVSLGKTGAAVSFYGSGEVGLRVKPTISRGTLDYTYNANVSLTYPRYPQAGERITVSAGFGSNTISTIRTTTPDFGAEFSGVAKLSGAASTDAWAFGKNLHTGQIFDFSVGGENPIGTFKFSDSSSLKLLADNLNFGVDLVNPTPIGVSVEIPKLEAGATKVGSDGTLTATGFGKFLSCDTTLLDWMLIMFPKKGNILGQVLGATQGDYGVPGTSYKVNWAIAKMGANLDVGFYGKYDLKPKPTIILQAQGFDGRIVAEGPAPLTFTMPAQGVRIVPTVTCKFDFTNLVAIGTGGSVGFYPFSGGAKGNLGIDIGSDTSVDFQFDVARLEWKGNPSGGSKIAEKTFELPIQTDTTQTLAAVGINPKDLNALPNEVFFGDTPLVADVHAYSTDADKTYRTIYASPTQGNTFLIFNRQGQRVGTVAARLHYKNGMTRALNLGQVGNESIPIQIPRTELTRGLHNVELSINTVNVSNQPVSRTYNISLQSYAANPIISGQANTYTDGSDPRGITNRVTTNGGDQKFYIRANNVFRDTEVLLDDTYVLPTDIANDQIITGDDTVGFTVPAALAKELGGAPHTIRLRTPGTGSRPDGTPYDYARSGTYDMFFVAEQPKLSAIEVPDEPTNKAPIGNVPVWVALKGSNFTRSTVATLKGYGGSDVLLETSYGTPTEMRVKLTPEILRAAHDNGKLSSTVTLTTPLVEVPADAQNVTRMSGGVSSPLAIGLRYPTPSITRLEPARIIRNSGVSTVRVYGDNLFRRSANGSSSVTIFRMGNRDLFISAANYPAGNDLIVPYVDVPLLAGQNFQNGRTTLSAYNGGTGISQIVDVITENGKPILTSLAKTTFRVGPGLNYDPQLFGAPFYNGETKISLNGVDVPILGMGTSNAYLGFSYDFLKTVPGASIKLQAYTPGPGGGTSNMLDVVLQEGDPSTVQVKRGGLTFDRATNTWRQPISLTYTGSRNVTGGARLVFRDLPAGITLTNAAGTMDGMPYLSSGLQPRRQITVVAIFRRTGSLPISFTPEIRFP